MIRARRVDLGQARLDGIFLFHVLSDAAVTQRMCGTLWSSDHLTRIASASLALACSTVISLSIGTEISGSVRYAFQTTS